MATYSDNTMYEKEKKIHVGNEANRENFLFICILATSRIMGKQEQRNKHFKPLSDNVKLYIKQPEYIWPNKILV